MVAYLVGRVLSTPASYSRDLYLNLGTATGHRERCRGFPQFLKANGGILSQIRPCLLYSIVVFAARNT
jgi:hypothetical protein